MVDRDELQAPLRTGAGTCAGTCACACAWRDGRALLELTVEGPQVRRGRCAALCEHVAAVAVEVEEPDVEERDPLHRQGREGARAEVLRLRHGDKWTGGQVDGWMGGWVGGWMDRKRGRDPRLRAVRQYSGRLRVGGWRSAG